MAASRKGSSSRGSRPRKTGKAKPSGEATKAAKRDAKKQEGPTFDPPVGINQTAHGRMLQATYIGIRRAQGVSMATVAKELKISKTTADRIVKEDRDADFAELLKRKPAEIVEFLIGERERNVALFTLAALQAETAAELVGALKGRESALDGLTTLLQETRFLPRNLGTVRHEIDLRQLGEHIVVLVAAVAMGKVPIEELPKLFQKLTGVELPETVEGKAVDAALELAA